MWRKPDLNRAQFCFFIARRISVVTWLLCAAPVVLGQSTSQTGRSESDVRSRMQHEQTRPRTAKLQFLRSTTDASQCVTKQPSVARPTEVVVYDEEENNPRNAQDLERSLSQIVYDAAPASKELRDRPVTGPAANVFGSSAAISSSALQSRFQPACFDWAAPGFYHQPLYFEEVNLERYGNYVGCSYCGDCAQSVISTAHFFGTVPFMPYKIGADPCCERQYTLGYSRPGNCNPCQLEYPEKSCHGAVYQGLATAGVIWFIP